MKYTIKELIDKVFDVTQVVDKYYKYFTEEDKKYCIEKNTERPIDNWRIFHKLYSEDDIKKLIEKGKWLEYIKYYFNHQLTPELHELLLQKTEERNKKRLEENNNG